MELEKKIMAIHLLVGVVAGYLSYIISSNIYALVIMMVFMYLMRHATNMVAKEKKQVSWWLGNGGFVFFFVWLVSWLVFFNLL